MERSILDVIRHSFVPKTLPLGYFDENPPEKYTPLRIGILHLSGWNRVMTLKSGLPVSGAARPWVNVEVTLITAEPMAPVFEFTVEIIEPSVGERRRLRPPLRTILRARGI